MKYLLIGALLVLGTAGKAQKPYYSKLDLDWEKRSPNVNAAPAYSVFLIGDAGEPDFTKPSALKVLEGHLKKADTNSIVVFLGDNIYPAGLPDSDKGDLGEAERKINAQLDILKAFKGRIVFVPGNHDWDHWSPEGLEAINREEAYIEKCLDRGNTFLPDRGCPGPAVINLTENLVLVSIDTQWWLHKWKKTNEANTNCPAIDDSSFIAELDRVLRENKDRQIIVTAHHPIRTNGNHGGRFNWKDHIFPLTAKYHNLYIPLPVLGSIYPLSRQLFGHIQDLPNPRYKLMAAQLTSVFSKYDNLIYAAGHDHNLQYITDGSQHYVVSGSGSKTTAVAKKHNASFTYARQGFVKLNHYSNRELWMEVWVTNDSIDDLGKLIYKKQLVNPTTPIKVP